MILAGSTLSDDERDMLSLHAPPDARHVERHLALSLEIAAALEADRAETELVRRASLLHEFGRVGFSYRLRDELVRFAAEHGVTEWLSRTNLVRAGLVADWPSADEVVHAIERVLGRARRRSKERGGEEFRRFERDRRALGVRWDGALPLAQQSNLVILFSHDERTLRAIDEHRPIIPFDPTEASGLLEVMLALVVRRAHASAESRELELAMALMAADQLELTNNRERWRRSRRRPAPDRAQGTGATWLELNLVDETIAGRDATLPSIVDYLVERPTDRAARIVGRRVAKTVAELVLNLPTNRTLRDVIEECRETPIPASEFRQLEQERAADRWG